MYEVLIGFQVVLEPEENWDGVIMETPLGREAVFAIGQKVKKLPKRTRAEDLEGMGAIKAVEGANSPSSSRLKVENDLTLNIQPSTPKGGGDG